jgi:hypothetical protein
MLQGKRRFGRFSGRFEYQGKGLCMGRLSRIGAFLALALVVAGCAGTYRTFYLDRVDPAVSRGWRVSDVAVRVPETLTVSEEHSLVPHADIVWREDPAEGDRRAQVATIMRDAARRGAAGLHGRRAVLLEIELKRFHALTFEAETRLDNAGVHNIDFVVTVRDARTGAVLAGPEMIEAATPAFSGAEARRLRAEGQTQKKVITEHVAATIAGWLGVGPDNRGEFQRLGD